MICGYTMQMMKNEPKTRSLGGVYMVALGFEFFPIIYIFSKFQTKVSVIDGVQLRGVKSIEG